MTTASARPDRLEELARRLAAVAGRVDDAVRSSPANPATPAAASSAEHLAALARDVRRVAGAFESADRGHLGAVARTDDARLVSRLHHRFAGFGGEVIDDALAHEDGRRLGRRLRRMRPAEALDRLRRRGPGPAWSSGMLEGLGVGGLARLVQRTDDAAAEALVDEADRHELLQVLADLVATADTDVVVRAVGRLGHARAGRRALRELAPHLPPGLPTPVVVELGAVTLLGRSAPQDAVARVGPEMADVRDLDPVSTTEAVLRLLAHDRAATVALDARVPGTRSLVMGLALVPLSPVGFERVVTMMGHVLDHAPEHQQARARRGLVRTAIAVDQDRGASERFADLVGRQLRGHPSLVDHLERSLDGVHDMAATEREETLTRAQRLYAVVARSDRALAALLEAFTLRRAERLADRIASAPPGSLTYEDVEEVLDAKDRRLHDLAIGADAAGRADRWQVGLGIQAAEWTAKRGLGTWSKRLDPVSGKVTSKAGGWAIDEAAAGARRRYAHLDDHRESGVELVLAADEALLVAGAMASDPRWRAVLRSDPPPPGTDRTEVRRWVDAQPRSVRRVLLPLLTPRLRRA